MIDVTSLSRRYGSVQALKDVSFHVERGHIMGLLGQNGAGKTTMLKILTGYLAPTEGKVSICGFDPLLEPLEAKRHLGYLPETPPLCDEMTVREYLRFTAELRGVLRRGLEPHIKQIIELCGLGEVQNRLIAHLSKGYRQRTGIAQALCGDPSVLVLDEPTVGLDPLQIAEIRDLIYSLGRDHTIIFSSHILSEVQQLCDQILILHRGQLRHETTLLASLRDECTLLFIVPRAGEEVLAALKRLDHVTQADLLPSCTSRKGSVLFVRFLEEPEPEAVLFALLNRMNIPLLHLSRKSNDLESVFLSVISKE